jgi:hypothetical protein
MRVLPDGTGQIWFKDEFSVDDSVPKLVRIKEDHRHFIREKSKSNEIQEKITEEAENALKAEIEIIDGISS